MQLHVRRLAPRIQLLMPRLFVLGFLMPILTSPLAFALDSDRDQPVHITADKGTFNQQTGVNVYTGNVLIIQGTIRLEADNIVVNLDKTNSLKNATATGKPAKFQQKISADKGIAYGEGNQVFYDAATAQITLTGNAKINQDGSSFNGNTLRYGMTQGDIEGSGNSQQRVEMVIPPSATKTPSSVKSR